MIRTLALCLILAAAPGSGPVGGADQSSPPGGRRDSVPPGAAEAIFAGGCFWCMESPFEGLDGVHAVIAGYTGGEEKDAAYKKVSSGATGHAEAVLVLYDPERISYRELLEVFWRQIDPTDAGGQFADRGSQYRTAIFYGSEEEKELAESSRDALERSGRFDGPIVTGIVPAGPFYPAEEYHQDFYRTNPEHYKRYRRGSGRQGFLEEAWGGGK